MSYDSSLDFDVDLDEVLGELLIEQQQSLSTTNEQDDFTTSLADINTTSNHVDSCLLSIPSFTSDEVFCLIRTGQIDNLQLYLQQQQYSLVHLKQPPNILALKHINATTETTIKSIVLDTGYIFDIDYLPQEDNEELKDHNNNNFPQLQLPNILKIQGLEYWQQHQDYLNSAYSIHASRGISLITAALNCGNIEMFDMIINFLQQQYGYISSSILYDIIETRKFSLLLQITNNLSKLSVVHDTYGSNNTTDVAVLNNDGVALLKQNSQVWASIQALKLDYNKYSHITFQCTPPLNHQAQIVYKHLLDEINNNNNNNNNNNTSSFLSNSMPTQIYNDIIRLNTKPTTALNVQDLNILIKQFLYHESLHYLQYRNYEAIINPVNQRDIIELLEQYDTYNKHILSGEFHHNDDEDWYNQRQAQEQQQLDYQNNNNNNNNNKKNKKINKPLSAKQQQRRIEYLKRRAERELAQQQQQLQLTNTTNSQQKQAVQTTLDVELTSLLLSFFHHQRVVNCMTIHTPLCGPRPLFIPRDVVESFLAIQAFDDEKCLESTTIVDGNKNNTTFNLFLDAIYNNIDGYHHFHNHLFFAQWDNYRNNVCKHKTIEHYLDFINNNNNNNNTIFISSQKLSRVPDINQNNNVNVNLITFLTKQYPAIIPFQHFFHPTSIAYQYQYSPRIINSKIITASQMSLLRDDNNPGCIINELNNNNISNDFFIIKNIIPIINKYLWFIDILQTLPYKQLIPKIEQHVKHFQYIIKSMTWSEIYIILLHSPIYCIGKFFFLYAYYTNNSPLVTTNNIMEKLDTSNTTSTITTTPNTLYSTQYFDTIDDLTILVTLQANFLAYVALHHPAYISYDDWINPTGVRNDLTPKYIRYRKDSKTIINTQQQQDNGNNNSNNNSNDNTLSVYSYYPQQDIIPHNDLLEILTYAFYNQVRDVNLIIKEQQTRRTQEEEEQKKKNSQTTSHQPDIPLPPPHETLYNQSGIPSIWRDFGYIQEWIENHSFAIWVAESFFFPVDRTRVFPIYSDLTQHFSLHHQQYDLLNHNLNNNNDDNNNNKIESSPRINSSNSNPIHTSQQYHHKSPPATPLIKPIISWSKHHQLPLLVLWNNDYSAVYNGIPMFRKDHSILPIALSFLCERWLLNDKIVCKPIFGEYFHKNFHLFEFLYHIENPQLSADSPIAINTLNNSDHLQQQHQQYITSSIKPNAKNKKTKNNVKSSSTTTTISSHSINTTTTQQQPWHIYKQYNPILNTVLKREVLSRITPEIIPFGTAPLELLPETYYDIDPDNYHNMEQYATCSSNDGQNVLEYCSLKDTELDVIFRKRKTANHFAFQTAVVLWMLDQVSLPMETFDVSLSVTDVDSGNNNDNNNNNSKNSNTVVPLQLPIITHQDICLLYGLSDFAYCNKDYLISFSLCNRYALDRLNEGYCHKTDRMLYVPIASRPIPIEIIALEGVIDPELYTPLSNRDKDAVLSPLAIPHQHITQSYSPQHDQRLLITSHDVYLYNQIQQFIIHTRKCDVLNQYYEDKLKQYATQNTTSWQDLEDIEKKNAIQNTSTIDFSDDDNNNNDGWGGKGKKTNRGKIYNNNKKGNNIKDNNEKTNKTQQQQQLFSRASKLSTRPQRGKSSGKGGKNKNDNNYDDDNEENDDNLDDDDIAEFLPCPYHAIMHTDVLELGNLILTTSSNHKVFELLTIEFNKHISKLGDALYSFYIGLPLFVDIGLDGIGGGGSFGALQKSKENLTNINKHLNLISRFTTPVRFNTKINTSTFTQPYSDGIDGNNANNANNANNVNNVDNNLSSVTTQIYYNKSMYEVLNHIEYWYKEPQPRNRDFIGWGLPFSSRDAGSFPHHWYFMGKMMLFYHEHYIESSQRLQLITPSTSTSQTSSQIQNNNNNTKDLTTQYITTEYKSFLINAIYNTHLLTFPIDYISEQIKYFQLSNANDYLTMIVPFQRLVTYYLENHMFAHPYKRWVDYMFHQNKVNPNNSHYNYNNQPNNQQQQTIYARPELSKKGRTTPGLDIVMMIKQAQNDTICTIPMGIISSNNNANNNTTTTTGNNNIKNYKSHDNKKNNIATTTTLSPSPSTTFNNTISSSSSSSLSPSSSLLSRIRFYLPFNPYHLFYLLYLQLTTENMIWNIASWCQR